MTEQKQEATAPAVARSKTITDADLNELTHAVADLIEDAAAITLNRYRLNDDLTALLAEHGVHSTED